MRIIVTQRSDDHGQYAERRDGLDRNWYMTLRQLFGSGSVLFPAPNDHAQIEAFIAAVVPEVLVLTGGNDLVSVAEGQNVAPDRDAVEQALLAHATKHCLPVLAVCRGFQYLNLFCEGGVVAVGDHVGGSHPVGLPDGTIMTVNSYHAYGISSDGLAADLRPLAHDAAGHVEAAHHKNLPWLGIMWHPERVQVDAQAELWLRRHLALYCGIEGAL